MSLTKCLKQIPLEQEERRIFNDLVEKNVATGMSREKAQRAAVDTRLTELNADKAEVQAKVAEAMPTAPAAEPTTPVVEGETPVEAATEGTQDVIEVPGEDKIVADRNTLYSGIPMDKVAKLFKQLGKPLGLTEEQWAKTVSDWKENWETTTENFTGAFGNRPTWHQVSYAARVLGFSNDGVLEWLGKKYDSPTIDKIRRMLWAPAGESDKATGLPWQDAVSRRSMVNLNAMGKLLKPLGRDEAALKQVATLMQNPENIKPGTPVHDAAKGLADLLQDELQYQRDAGVDIGEVKDGYFPRETDVAKITDDTKGFHSAATRAYKATYGSEVTQTQAEDMAQAYMRNILMSDIGVNTDGTDFARNNGVPKPDHVKKRIFNKQAETILQPYMMTNPVDVLSSYFVKSARRAEWERRFSAEKWKAMRKDLENEVPWGVINTVVKTIESSTGNTTGNFSHDTGNLISWLRTWNALAFLPRATISSLSEIAMTAVRTGDVRTLGRNFVTTFRELGNSHKNEELRAISEEVLGLTGQVASDMLMAQRFGGQVDSKAAQHLTNRFFYYTGLHQWTEATRIGAIDVGQWYLKRLTNDIVNDTSRRKSSEMALKEMGIEDPQAFARQAVKSGDLSAEKLKVGGQFEEQYKTALQRFVDQTIMNPKAVERPRYANTPVGSLAYALLSFIYSFHKNVLSRTAKMAGQAVTGKGLTAADRFALAAPALMLTLPFLVQLGISELRDEVLFKDPARKNKDRTDTDKILTAWSRAGLFGALDPLANIYTSAKYEREPATVALGPLLGLMSEMFMATVTLKEKNTLNTNTAERNAAKHFYNLFVAPAGNLVGSLIPVPLVGAATIQASSHPYVRSTFMDMVGGKATQPKASRKRRTRPGRPRRQTGR